MTEFQRRDVVVTGMGAVTPFGTCCRELWDAVYQGRSGVDWMTWLDDLDPKHYPVRFGGEVKNFNVDELLRKHCDVRRERAIQMALVAAREALEQAGLLDVDREVALDPSVTAIIGSGHSCCHENEFLFDSYYQRGPRKVKPSTIPRIMFNGLASHVSIHFGLQGANHVIAAACSSGAASIGLGLLLIRHGYADIVLCGGADSPLTPAYFAAWTNMRVLAKHDNPQQAARPFDRHRTGLVLAEGAGIVVLESLESARRRGVDVLARIVGYGTSSDAHHITAPTIDGQVMAMRACLADAGRRPEQVDYINLHGTGTKANDDTEARAVTKVFGPRGSALPMSSTKSMSGHLLGTSAAIEFIVCVESIRHNFVPPTLNCEEADPDIGLDYVPCEGRKHPVDVAMSNSFGFGGNNAVLLLEQFA